MVGKITYWLVPLFLLNMALSQTTDESLDAVLDVAKQYYKNGAYTDAIDTFESILVQLQDSARIEAHKYLAFSLIAIGDYETAHENFKKALKLAPRLKLDQANTSPQILNIFRKAKQERAFESAMCSCFIPGIGQVLKGEETKGKIVIAVSGLTFAAVMFSWFVADTKHDFYSDLGPDDIDIMDHAYHDYNRWYKTSILFSALFTSVYVYSIIDAMLLKENKQASILKRNRQLFLGADKECLCIGYTIQL